ncbi:MAG: hypothetical protein Q4G13_09510 [Moraxella sp.]|nr:hypothetical protein [Moraxella sp.]
MFIYNSKTQADKIDTQSNNTPAYHITDNNEPYEQTTHNYSTNHSANHKDPFIPEHMRKFVAEVENLLTTTTNTRQLTISSLIALLKQANNNDEKVLTLQALESLQPIEFADDLIFIAQSTKESDRVRQAAMSALNEAYVIDDEYVAQIGGATVYRVC